MRKFGKKDTSKVMNSTASQEESFKGKKRKSEKDFNKQTVAKQFAHLATFYDEDEVLNLQTAKLPKRFGKYLRKMKEEAGTMVQPCVTLEEREMLVEISGCKGLSEAENLLATWYSKKDLSINCRYIRFALAASFELWSANTLLNKNHGEDWYRMHVYSNVWEKAFHDDNGRGLVYPILYGRSFHDDNELETKRSECVSQVMKALKETQKDVKLQKLDFILRDLNTKNDIVTVEEKPSLKGVKTDIKKGEMLKKNALYLWSKQVRSNVLMEQLEAISCQWQGTKFTIYGSRLLSSGNILNYKKGSFNFPISAKHLPDFSKILMAIISLKRVVKLNYAKFILILEEKNKQEIERLSFCDSPLNAASFISNSTNSDCEEEEKDDDEEDHENFVEKTLFKLNQMKPEEEGLKKFSDWEEMLLFDCAKRRRTQCLLLPFFL